ncbi:MAG: hypothetical protein IT518_28975 [Burkholderiales bacterium]|nr:hypothetical protein [Burkholderiales bacterium]
MNINAEVLEPAPADVLAGSPARKKVAHILNDLTPIEQRAMARYCAWLAEQFVDSVPEIDVETIRVLMADGSRVDLAELDIQVIIAAVVQWFTHARSRRDRQRMGLELLAAKEAEALPQSWR